MKKQFCTIVLSLVGLCQLHARLTESKDEISKRYGEGKSMKFDTKDCELFEYKNQTFEIQVLFYNGKSVRESIKYTEHKLTDLEIEDLLRKTHSSDGHHWIAKVDDTRKKKKHRAAPKYWVRDDKKAEASREGVNAKWLRIEDVETMSALGLLDKPEV